MLENMHISQDVKRYLDEIGHVFSDTEMATIIWHMETDFFKRIERLETLASSTENIDLEQQIRNRVAYEKECLTAFQENMESKYVYVLKADDDEMWDLYFDEYDSAKFYAARLWREVTIEKHKVSHGESFPPIGQVLWGSMELDNRGDISRVISDEIPQMVETFENYFIALPNPFERGDIVRDIRTGKVGIVEQSRESEEAFLEKVEEGQWVDSFDIGITVSFLEKDGKLEHSHPWTLLLERVEESQLKENEEILKDASGMLRGKTNLDCFMRVYDDVYRKDSGDDKEIHFINMIIYSRREETYIVDRCVGCFKDFYKAWDIVINNYGDLAENGMYKFCCIESIPVGLYRRNSARKYFEYDYEKDKYVSCQPLADFEKYTRMSF